MYSYASLTRLALSHLTFLKRDQPTIAPTIPTQKPPTLTNNPRRRKRATPTISIKMEDKPPPSPIKSRYIKDKVNDPYYGRQRRGRRRSCSKTTSIPHRRPADNPLGYNPWAEFKDDDVNDWPAFEPMTRRNKISPINWERDSSCGAATVPGIVRGRERASEKRNDGFEEEYEGEGKTKAREEKYEGKGKGKEVERDEDEDEDEDEDDIDLEEEYIQRDAELKKR